MFTKLDDEFPQKAAGAGLGLGVGLGVVKVRARARTRAPPVHAPCTPCTHSDGHVSPTRLG